MAEGTKELGRLVYAEPRRGGAAEHRVRFVVPLEPQQCLGLQRHHLEEQFIITDETCQDGGVNAAMLAACTCPWRKRADLRSAVGAVGHGGLSFLEHGDPVLEPARVAALGDAALHRLRTRNIGGARGFLGRLLEVVDGLVRFS